MFNNKGMQIMSRMALEKKKLKNHCLHNWTEELYHKLELWTENQGGEKI